MATALAGEANGAIFYSKDTELTGQARHDPDLKSVAQLSHIGTGAVVRLSFGATISA